MMIAPSSPPTMESEPIPVVASPIVVEPPSNEDAVLHALQSARYNEIVHLEVQEAADGEDNDVDHATDDDHPAAVLVRDICLVACLDEKHGGITWNPLAMPESDAVADDDNDHENPLPRINPEIQRHLRTKRWVLPMLNDHRRNDLYQRATVKAADRVARSRRWKNETPDPVQENGSDSSTEVVVLDIGSGSGLLSMMAARSILDWHQTEGARLNHPPRTPLRPSVVAVEMSSAMAHLSRNIVPDNDLNDCIQIVNAHSTQVEVSEEQHSGANAVLSRRADLCVSELLESGLLGEGLLPSMRDAWERLLAPDAVIVPASVRVYAAAVQQGVINSHDDGDSDDTWMSRYHPATLCRQGDGVGWKALFDDSEDDPHLSRPLIVPVHATKLLRDDQLVLLTEPACLLTIHLDKDRIPSEQGQNHQLSIPVTKSGSMHGFLVWWELDLWECNEPTKQSSITYSMDPRDDSLPFQDHWQQCLHVLPNPQNVLGGETISVLASHDDSSVQLDLLSSDVQEVARRKRPRPEVPRPVPFAFSYDRVFQLTDPVRSKFLRTSIEHAISSFSSEQSDLHVLDVSDFGLCGLYAALHRGGADKNVNITCMESGGGPMTEWTSRVAQASDLPKSCRFEILACHAEQLDRTILGGSAPHMVVAEPYYQVLEGWHLQEALNYYYLVRSLRHRSMLAPEAIAVPSFCRIMACGIESHHLRASYSPCGDGESSNVCGFDHSELNRHACVALHTLSLPLWQYDFQRLTVDIEIGRLDYMNPLEGDIRSTTTLSFRQAGMLDAIMIWLEYGYGTTSMNPATESRTAILSTNAPSYRQGVRMLKRPVQVTSCTGSTVVVRVDFAVGGLHGFEDHMMDVRVEESVRTQI